MAIKLYLDGRLVEDTDMEREWNRANDMLVMAGRIGDDPNYFQKCWNNFLQVSDKLRKTTNRTNKTNHHK